MVDQKLKADQRDMMDQRVMMDQGSCQASMYHMKVQAIDLKVILKMLMLKAS